MVVGGAMRTTRSVEGVIGDRVEQVSCGDRLVNILSDEKKLERDEHWGAKYIRI